MKTFSAFPDIELKASANPANFSLSDVILTSTERGTSCHHNPEEIIKNLEKKYAPGSPEAAKMPTQLEVKIWAKDESKLFDFLNNTNIPSATRLEVSEVWERKPDPEAEYVKKLSDNSLTLDERLKMIRDHDGEQDPAELQARQTERINQLNDDKISTLEKLDIYFD
ncbi:hypothetical protein ACFOG5_07790 [Pedobacter fastidiosus]|uniref:Uncharacterized protein n=2 Tax=Pedobacter fastidiosus TaxID=2765361 RepID=A0ABR7KQF9_9SPHI|nr:hypothetical protein [Pedobacter fastidiosus]